MSCARARLKVTTYFLREHFTQKATYFVRVFFEVCLQNDAFPARA